MPDEYDLNCYKAKLDDMLKVYDGLYPKQEIKRLMVQAYKAGYAQCEQDCRIQCGM